MPKQAAEKPILTSVAVMDIEVSDDAEPPCRMRKKTVQQGRSERRGEAYSVPYGEPLSDARTPLAVFFPHPAKSHRNGDSIAREHIKELWDIRRSGGDLLVDGREHLSR